MSNSDYVVIIAFLIATTTNNIITYKLIKNEVHKIIYDIFKVLVFIAFYIAITCTDYLEPRFYILTYIGLLLTIPSFKKKDKTACQ